MNNALAILGHALRMLSHEPATTIRVIAPALMVVMAATVAALLVVPDLLLMFTAPPDTYAVPQGSSVLILLILGLAGLVGYALMAILWHRHVLLNGTSGHSDLRSGYGVIMGYMWRATIVALVQFVVAIPIGIAMAVLASVGTALTGGVAFLFVIGVAAGLVFIWVALRLSLVLPAASLGNIMRIGESWEATAPAAQTLWGVAALLALINMVISLVSGAILPDSFAISMIVQTVIFIVEGLVFVSVLTTLYGHLVEGRSLG